MAQTDLRFTFEVQSSQEDTQDSGSTSLSQLNVVSFMLEEALNTPFVLDIELVSFDPAIDFASIIDKPALFTIYQGGVAVRHVHGLVSDFEQGKTGHRRTFYRSVVQPSLARLNLTSDWRIFQQQTAGDVLSAVLKANHIDSFEINTQLEHLAREYLVQPGVLDLSFVNRLAAQEGYVYRIESTASNHRLLFTDIIQTFGSLAQNKDGTPATAKDEQGDPLITPVIYNPNAGGDRQQPALRSFTYKKQVRTARQTQRDYTFKNPRYNLEIAAHGKNLGGQSTRYEQYDYGVDAQYKQDAVGRPFTTTKIQSLRNDAATATVVGDDARIQPGIAFQLQGHQREDWNCYWRPVYIKHTGTQYTSAEEDAAGTNQSTSYEQKAILVLATENWKADIPPPHKIDGPLIAHVTTPAGEEIYCDEYGRVKVIFPWQRNEQPNEHSSCWIRVAQNWAGAGWGHIAIPRNGQEVIVQFLGADESQPVVTGRTYDANHPTPYKLPALKTQQTTKSKEHKGSGYNELLIDDTTGEIKTKLHTTHDVTQLTMGFLTHPRKDDGSGEHRGDGFELRTDTHGAVRAGAGIYISTDKRDKAEGKQLDMQEAIAQLDHALNIAKEINKAHQTAQTHQNDSADQESQLQEVYQDLKKAGLLMSSPEGIATTTPKSTQITSNQNLTITTGQSTDISAWEDVRIGAKDKVSILAVEDELKLVANKGVMKIQAQNNQMEVAAQKDLKIMSTEDKVEFSAEKEILLTSGGAYIRIKGGHIEIHAPGIIDHKAAAYPFTGPTSLNSSYSLPPEANLSLDPLKQNAHFILSSRPEGRGLVYDNSPYQLFKDGALLQEGLSDEKGFIHYEYEAGAKYELKLANGVWYGVTPMEASIDKDEVLARSLGNLGHRYVMQEKTETNSTAAFEKVDQLKARFFQKHDTKINDDYI